MAFGLPNVERIVSNFLEGGTGITSIRNVEWDKNFLWAVDFVQSNNSITAPQPFDAFFPAADVNLNLGSVISQQFEQGQAQFTFPKSTKVFDMSVTFYDNEQKVLLNWFKDWINLDIFNNGEFVSGLGDNHFAVAADSIGESRKVFPIRQIRLALLDAWRNDVKIFDYMVYPDGDFNFSGAQSSDANQYTVNFMIVEDLTSNRKTGISGGFSFDEVKKFIGRFI